jgi:hypothetical protein
MGTQLKSSSKIDAISSISSFTEDNHGHCSIIRHNDNISLALPSNCTTVATGATTTNTHCMLNNDHHVQQRYTVLADVDVQVCRVPRRKNIIDKICFSRCFRHWQGHHISLEQSQIISTTVGYFYNHYLL